MSTIQRAQFRPTLRPATRGFRVPLAVLLVPLFLLAAGPAAAGPVPALQVSPDTTEVIPLAPLEVSVLRSPVTLDAAPLAVGALGPSELRDGRSAAFLEEALQGLPGVQVQNRFNPAVGERVGVRGFGARAQFGSEGIRVVVDGIPATLPDGQSTLDHVDIGSLERVEVVRGAASALFGNASGGVLFFHSRRPVSRPFQLELEQAGGSHGLARTEATATGTSGGTGYLVTVSRQTWDGFRIIPNSEDGSNYGSADRLGLNARVVRTLGGGELSLTANALDLDSENPGALSIGLLDDPDRPAFAGSVTQGLGKEVRQLQVGSQWAGPLGTFDTEFSLFGIMREVVNPIPGNIIDLSRDGGGFRAQVARTEEMAAGSFRWYFGVESEFMFDDRLNFANVGGNPGDLRLDQRERVRSAGVFAQANFPVLGYAEGLAGLRYDRHDFRARDRFPREEGEPSATGDRTMDAFSPSIGVNVPLGRGFGLFASVGTTFEVPTTLQLVNRPDGGVGFNPDLDPMRGTSSEVGVRGRVGTHATFEVTTFRTGLRNELVQFTLPDDRNYFENVGRSRHKGMEATVSAASPTGLVRGDLTYSQIDAHFKRFQKGDEDLIGNRIPGVAPKRLQGRLRLNPSTGFAELFGSWVDRVPANDENTASAPSYLVMDVRAGTRPFPVAGVTLAPWAAVTNVLDRQYIASVHVNAFAPPANPAAARYYEPGPGRSFQLGMRATWGVSN